jgi:hypothetical protein
LVKFPRVEKIPIALSINDHEIRGTFIAKFRIIAGGQ